MEFLRILCKQIARFLLLLVVVHVSVNATTYTASIDVFVNRDGVVTFKLSTPGQAGASISDFGIVEGEGGVWAYTKPVWSLTTTPGNFVDVAEIVYGDGVPGFTSSKAVPLVSGKHYMAELNGAGIATGIEFVVEIVNGKMVAYSLGMAHAHPRVAK